MTTVLPPRTTANEEPPVIGVDSVRARWSLTLDGAVAGAAAAFAVWTVLYEIALALDLSSDLTIIGWLVVGLPAGVVTAVANRAHATEASDPPLVHESDPKAGLGGSRSRRGHAIRAAAFLAIAASAPLLALGRGYAWSAGWILALLALALIAVSFTYGTDARDDSPIDARSVGRVQLRVRRSDLVTMIVSVVVSTASLFIYRSWDDDAYYLNFSTWVTERGGFPLRDTMFSDQAYPTTYGGGYPISSIEGLIGALARVLHLASGTMAYLVVAPLLGFASIWVLGMLARTWARHRFLPVFAWSALFVLAGGGGVYRGYSIRLIWEGKAAAVAILMPLIWVYATRLARSRSWHWVLMLGIVGVAFIGLTSTAAILVPVIAVSLVIAAAVLHERRLLWGAVVLSIGPLLGGLAVATLSRSVGGPAPTAPTPWNALRRAYGNPPILLCLTIAALLLAPLLLRGRSRILAWSAAIVPFALLTPGVLTLGNALTHSGPVEWRMLLSPPMPTLVGITAAGIVHRAITRTGNHPAKVVIATLGTLAGCALLVFAGTPPWASHLHFASRPVWKTHAIGLANVKALVATDPPHGQPILMPADEMAVLSLYTVRWHGVAPKRFYIAGLDEPPANSSARRTLVDLAEINRPNPTYDETKAALTLLNVGTVCLSVHDHRAQRLVERAGFGPFANVGTLRCATRPSAGQAAAG